jgi:hypothetical protein
MFQVFTNLLVQALAHSPQLFRARSATRSSMERVMFMDTVYAHITCVNL